MVDATAGNDVNAERKRCRRRRDVRTGCPAETVSRHVYYWTGIFLMT